MRAYIKRNKNDAADAGAICEAVHRPTMRFVQVKSAEQQVQPMQHRAHDLLMHQRAQGSKIKVPPAGKSPGANPHRETEDGEKPSLQGLSC